MTNKKMMAQTGVIQRALGMLEGVSCGVDEAAAVTIMDAVHMIEGALKELAESGK